jgi:P-type Mg2+ transporter
MLAVTLLVAFVSLLLPYTPLRKILGFTPLPSVYLLLIAGIVIFYFFSAEAAKRWFYHHFNL